MEPKERPILFSGPMVCAILQGLKTQTRRVAKVASTSVAFREGTLDEWVPIRQPRGTCLLLKRQGQPYKYSQDDVERACPYGRPGDRLWIRESYYQRGHWEPVPGVETKSGRMKWRFVPADDVIRFDEPSEHRKGRHHKDPSTVAWHRRLARFMPRRASRITLEIVSVRAQRLHQISEDDAREEGVEACLSDGVRIPHGGCLSHAMNGGHRHRCAFRDLWKHINGPESWDANPWVWAVTFKRLEVSHG